MGCYEYGYWGGKLEGVSGEYKCTSDVVVHGCDTYTGWSTSQGNYYTEAYGKPGKETKQAKDEQLGDNFWNLCSELAMDILGDDVQ